jgi:hypothetical protein
VCNTILESKHQHDFQRCNCSNGAFVDGGLSYIRCGANDLDLIEDISEYEEAVVWGVCMTVFIEYLIYWFIIVLGNFFNKPP